MLHPEWFMGRVEDIDDPLKENRVKVRCYGDNDPSIQSCPTENLLWADVALGTNAAGIHGIGSSIHGLKVGSEVFGIYLDGLAMQQPIIMAVLASYVSSLFVPDPTVMQIMPQQSSKIANFHSNAGPAYDQNQGVGTRLQGIRIANTPLEPITLGTLTPVLYQRFKAIVGHTESRDRYNITNTLGYVGKYQFGILALRTLNFVNTPSSDNSELNYSSVWTGRMDINSVTDWLNNGPVQEVAMDELIRLNYYDAIRNGIFTSTSPPSVIAGYLGAMQLGGIGGALDLKRGIDEHDAYGSSCSLYYQICSEGIGKKIT